jgi:hypothetical protein
MSASPESLAILKRAADLRALGRSWDEAANQLAVGLDELQRLASEHHRDYERLSRRARNELHRQAVSTALVTLIKLMSSPEPGVGILAATTFVRYDTALMRHRGKEAATRLERVARELERDGERTITVNAREPRAQNVQESSEVLNRQKVDAAKNAAQSNAPASAPKPATAKPPTRASAPPDATARRKQRLLEDAVLGRTARTPLPRGDREALEAERLINGWLADDAPPG